MYYPSICLDGLWKPLVTSFDVACFRDEIWTLDLRNTKRKCCVFDSDIRCGRCSDQPTRWAAGVRFQAGAGCISLHDGVHNSYPIGNEGSFLPCLFIYFRLFVCLFRSSSLFLFVSFLLMVFLCLLLCYFFPYIFSFFHPSLFLLLHFLFLSCFVSFLLSMFLFFLPFLFFPFFFLPLFAYLFHYLFLPFLFLSSVLRSCLSTLASSLPLLVAHNAYMSMFSQSQFVITYVSFFVAT
jgi:hypothetical protein